MPSLRVLAVIARAARIAWPALVVFACAYTAVVLSQAEIQRWIYHTGKRCGARVYFESGGAFMAGGRGVFQPDTFAGRAGNIAFEHAAWLLPALAGLVCAAPVFALCNGPLAKFRLFTSRGETRCGGCGYALVGLKEPRCPECGRTI